MPFIFTNAGIFWLVSNRNSARQVLSYSGDTSYSSSQARYIICILLAKKARRNLDFLILLYIIRSYMFYRGLYVASFRAR